MMDMVERVARAIWGDLSYRPIGWEAATEAALANAGIDVTELPLP